MPSGWKISSPHIPVVVAAIESADDLTQDVPACVRAVPGLFARDPATLLPCRTDPGDDLVPRCYRPAGVDPAEAGGMGEDMPEGDRFLAVLSELGNVPGDRVVQASFPRSQSCAIATAPIGLLPDSQSMSVSGVIATPGRDSPNARSAIGWPWMETYTCAPMCRPEAMPCSMAFRVADIEAWPAMGNGLAFPSDR